MFPTYQFPQKGFRDFFLFCLELELLINNSRSKQNKKNPEHHFADIGKSETCTKFQQKILIFMDSRTNFR